MNIPSYKTIRNLSSALACTVLFSACATTAAPTVQPVAPAQNKLSIGQQLVVPGHLMPLTKNTAQTTVLPTAVAIQRPAAPQQRNLIDDVGPDAAKVQIAKANPNKRFVLRPLGSDVSGDSAAELVENDFVKIIGSYFPKVVYRSPQLNAKPLMRVAPGSIYKLEKLADDWYQISTEQGSGYLRLQDGKPTNTMG